MKIIYFSIFLILAINTYAQTDYSGLYGVDGNSYSNDLTLLKIDATHYKFWVSAFSQNYVNTGDGIFEMKGDSGIYKNINDSDSEYQWCNLIFKLTSKNIEVVIEKSKKLCNVLLGDHIVTTYPLLKRVRISQKEFLKEYEENYSLYKVITPKTPLYLDSSFIRMKNRYFKNGDILIESGFNDFSAKKAIQVEYLSNAGEFISGWVKKEDVVLTKNQR
jgi:hypothetical protein